MYIIGLTGSMGAGKSKATFFFRSLRVPVHSADETVHNLLKHPMVIRLVKTRWPQVVHAGTVDRKLLAQQIFSKPEEVAHLEKILYPCIQQLRRKFLGVNARKRHKLVVLDVPLLFEKKLDIHCDAVAVVSTSPLLQAQRLLKRTGMTPVLMNQILGYQLSAAQKRKKAQYLLCSGLHPGHLFRQIKYLVKVLAPAVPRKWSCRWTGSPGRP